MLEAATCRNPAATPLQPTATHSNPTCICTCTSVRAGALFVPLFDAWAEGALVPAVARHRWRIAALTNGVELTVPSLPLALLMVYCLLLLRYCSTASLPYYVTYCVTALLRCCLIA